MKTLIKNIEIITMDDENRHYPEGAILYEDDTIVYAGPSSGLDSRLIKAEPGKFCQCSYSHSHDCLPRLC
jgi:hypothetical protein